jgi:hypothetical protein
VGLIGRVLFAVGWTREDVGDAKKNTLVCFKKDGNASSRDTSGDLSQPWLQLPTYLLRSGGGHLGLVLSVLSYLELRVEIKPAMDTQQLGAATSKNSLIDTFRELGAKAFDPNSTDDDKSKYGSEFQALLDR